MRHTLSTTSTTLRVRVSGWRRGDRLTGVCCGVFSLSCPPRVRFLGDIGGVLPQTRRKGGKVSADPVPSGEAARALDGGGELCGLKGNGSAPKFLGPLVRGSMKAQCVGGDVLLSTSGCQVEVVGLVSRA